MCKYRYRSKVSRRSILTENFNKLQGCTCYCLGIAQCFPLPVMQHELQIATISTPRLATTNSKQRAAKLCGAPLLLITSHGDSPPCKPNPCERCSHFLLSEAEGAPGGGGEAGEVTVGDHHLEAQGQHSHQDNLQVPRVRIHGGQGRLMQGSSNPKQQSPKRKSKPTVI